MVETGPLADWDSTFESQGGGRYGVSMLTVVTRSMI